MTQKAKNKLAPTNQPDRVNDQTATTKKMRHHKKPTTPQKCSTWNNTATVAAFILICLLIGAGLASAF